MCSPGMGAMMGLDVAGGLLQADAAEKAANAKKNYYDYLAGQNEARAKTALQSGEDVATSVAETSAIDERNLNRSASRVRGAQRAALGASGVTADSVTSEDIARDTARTHDLDVTALRFDADSKAWSARVSAENQAKALQDQAASFRYAGANAKYAGEMDATTSLLGSATSVADNWYRWNQTSGGRSAPSVKTRGGVSRGGYATAPDYGNA